MKLSEYYSVDENAELLLSKLRIQYYKFCDKKGNCSECKYQGSNNCFLEYIKDNDVEL